MENSARWTWAGAGLIVASVAGFVFLFVGPAFSVPPLSYDKVTLLGALFVALGTAGGYLIWHGQFLSAEDRGPSRPVRVDT